MKPRSVEGRTDILIYDADPGGHRANYVRIFEDATGGAGLIAPVRAALRRLLAARSLVLTTLDTAPKAFLLILILRSLIGRRSAVVWLRAHLMARRTGVRALPGRLVVRLLGRIEAILPMSLVRFERAGGGRGFVAIQDPEFWDLTAADLEAAETPLAARIREFAGGRAIVLLIGNLDPSKGLAFLRDIFGGDPRLIETIVPAICGPVLAEGRDAVEALRGQGAFVESRYLEHAELMSLYRAADAAWCCYPPERDLSSGILGRAVQFGVAPILRRGSALDAMAADVPNAIRLDYGDAAAAREALRARPARVARPRPRGAQLEALRALLLGHFGVADARAGS